MKVFEGEAYRDLLDRAGSMFSKAKGFKPVASRGESVEMFVICAGQLSAAERDQDGGGPTEAEQIAPPRPKPGPGWSS